MGIAMMAALLPVSSAGVVESDKVHIDRAGMRSDLMAFAVTSLAFEELLGSMKCVDIPRKEPFQLSLRRPEESTPPLRDLNKSQRMAKQSQSVDVCLSFFGSGTRPGDKAEKNKLTSRVNHKR
jgi:hypothetical protein